ncbi:hypothetical protein Tco_1354163 [Tanacetum coccineum]
MAKPIPNNAHGQMPAEPRNERNVKIEFSKELLTELQNNTFSRRREEDVTGHIGKVLELLDLVKIARVDPFSTPHESLPSLTFKGRKRMVDERGEWKYFHLGRVSEEIFQEILSHIIKEEGLLNDEVSSDEEWEEQEYGNPPKDSFPKPYFKMDKNNHNEKNRNTYKSSDMDLSGAPQSENINNEQPNEEICRVDKFEVIKYMIGDNEEFLAIYTRECDSWARTVNGVSSIYHDIFRKKDEGWTVHRTK